GFHPELTGRENIYLNGAILGMKKAEIERKFDEIVAFAEIERFLDTPVKRYSSGMYVRLAFAVAAHLEPEILLVDEVLAVGDVAFQKKCLGKMGDVAKEGRTVLFVSHNMLAIRALCTRALMLEQGRIVFEGDTSTAVSLYLGEEEETFRGGVVSGDELKAGGDHYSASGESFLECREISVLDRSGQPRERFSSSEEIIVSVTFECLQAVPCFYLIIDVESEDQANIMRTENLDDPNNQENSLNPGVYRVTSTFPADLWGNNRYFLSVYLHYQGVQHLRFRRIVSFDVDFQGYSDAFLDRPRGKDSFVRPRLRWQTEVVSAK
ncbi:MAG: ABC transporter ATP-binding protein, partial [Candidatus Atribacteria bacterium]|nr:ABC transporter ATP-binding protein [Candidatus Atribacteria bacterium]